MPAPPRPLPGIGTKAFLALLCGLLLFVAVAAAAIVLLVRPQLQVLEAELARKDLRAFEVGVAHELDKLETYAREYAFWDETYARMDAPPPVYAADYFSAGLMADQGIDLLLLFNRAGRPLFGMDWYGVTEGGRPRDLGQETPAALAGLGRMEPGGRTVRRGIVQTPDGIVLAAAVGVTNNDGSAPEAGMFLAGTVLDGRRIGSLARALGLEIAAYPLDGAVPAAADRASSAIGRSGGDFLFIAEDGGGRIWKLLRDPAGRAVMVLSLESSRAVTAANDRQMWFMFGAFVVGSLFLLALAWFWLRRQILGPLGVMARSNEAIRTKEDFSVRLPAAPTRELDQLAGSFNGLLDRLVELNTGLECTIKNRTRELVEANRDLHLMGEIFNHAIEGMLITDPEQRIVAVNPAFCVLTGYRAEEAIGRNPRFLQSGQQTPAFYRDMWRILERHGSWAGELWDRHKDGRLFPLWMSISVIRDARNEIVNYMGVMRDISEVKEQEKALHVQAFFDPLTTLPNRLLLRDRMEKALLANRRKNLELAVIFLDLDNFKNINDSLGHAHGDRVLIEVSKRLRGLVRPSDTVCRLGGDEFVIMLEEQADEHSAIHLAGRIIKALESPVEIEDHSLLMGASIGICISPQDGDSFEILLRNADTAMYRAKDSGKNSFCLFLPEMNERAVKRIRLEQDLPKALGDGSIRVWYQPKYALASRRIVGVEALVRWYRNGGIIEPADFVPMAEDIGLVGSLDIEVLSQACRDHRTIKEATGYDLVMAVNCSPKVLHNLDLCDRIARTLDAWNMDASRLELEITETSLMKDFAVCLRMLNKIHSLGITLALDDFGTGYSSLVQLSRLPLETLKIDRSFVIDLMNFQTANIVTTILSMARSLGLVVVAEGVEEDYQMSFLEKQGCDIVQGYLISQPVPLEELIALIEAERRSQGGDAGPLVP